MRFVVLFVTLTLVGCKAPRQSQTVGSDLASHSAEGTRGQPDLVEVDYPWLKFPAPNPILDRATLEEDPNIDWYVGSIVRGYTEGAYSYLNAMLRQSVVDPASKNWLFREVKSESQQENLQLYADSLGVSKKAIHDIYVRYYQQLYAIYNFSHFRQIKLVRDHGESDSPLWRGVGNCKYFQDEFFVDDGFGSTSVSEEVGRNFAKADGCLLKIVRGKRGFDVMAFSASIHEEEILLEPHQIFRVVSRGEKVPDQPQLLEVESLGFHYELGDSPVDRAAYAYWEAQNLAKWNDLTPAQIADMREDLDTKFSKASFLVQEIPDDLIIQ